MAACEFIDAALRGTCAIGVIKTEPWRACSRCENGVNCELTEPQAFYIGSDAGSVGAESMNDVHCESGENGVNGVSGVNRALVTTSVRVP